MSQPECFIVVNRKARKAHKCCECWGTIQPKEQYVVTSGIWDGEPGRFKMCPECYKQFNYFNLESINEGDEGVMFGSLYEWIFESKDVKTIVDFIIRMRTRGAKVEPWMYEDLFELLFEK